MNMKQQSTFSIRRIPITTSAIMLMVALLLLSACTRQPQPPRTEEITFESGSFHVVGDLRLPEGTGPFPVILFVHGSGDADRTLFGLYLPIMERMLRAGYATFAWDKPGYGESTGEFTPDWVHRQRAQIVLDAIDVMKTHPDIDPGQIGLWGISQAAWVMPRVLAQSKDIAFMTCVSCAGISSDDQMAFQIISQAICAGVPEEKAAELGRLLSELDRARTFETYDEYLHYHEVLETLAGLVSVSIENWPALSEEDWQKNDPNLESLWNPIEVIEQVRIPVLIINGDKDTNGDAIQGAYAWRKALEQAGNPNFRIELYPGVNHYMTLAETSCIAEGIQTFDQVLQDQGYGSIKEAFVLFQQEPGEHTPLSKWPYAPGFLDLQEEWLRDLRR
jgi:pimeloyl-ACP methyl ester carboxylesterase